MLMVANESISLKRGQDRAHRLVCDALTKGIRSPDVVAIFLAYSASLSERLPLNDRKESVMKSVRHKRAGRVCFDPPFHVRLLTKDGSLLRECDLLEVSDKGARIQYEGDALEDKEFFLILSGGARPAFRCCKLTWCRKDQIGVLFDKISAAALPDLSCQQSWQLPA